MHDPANGEETELGATGALQYPEDISADGRMLVFVERTPGFDIFTAPADPFDRPSALVRTTFNDYQPRLSPDGRSFAFVSNESGRNQVYVSTYPPSGLKTPVSVAGGTVPRWSRDGKELFFLASDRRLMAVPVQVSPTLALGQPAALFALPGRRI
jgi:eukaryotic-like serine/threonine-protein kinase